MPIMRYFRKKTASVIWQPIVLDPGVNDNYAALISQGWTYAGQYDGSAYYGHVYPSTPELLNLTYTQVLIEDYTGNSYMYNHPAGQYYKPGLSHTVSVYRDHLGNWLGLGERTVVKVIGGHERAITFKPNTGTKVGAIGDYEFNENNTNNEYNYNLKFYVR